MKAMNPNAVIELRDVAIFHFDDALREASFRGNGRTSDMVLSDVNLTVFPGELVYLIGRVGSGKSSLLKTLYAELPLREGGGMVVGFDLRRMRRKGLPVLVWTVRSEQCKRLVLADADAVIFENFEA